MKNTVFAVVSMLALGAAAYPRISGQKVVQDEMKRLNVSYTVDEPAVVIAQRPCALLKTVKYTGHAVSTDACRKCGVCMKLGCPAITKKEDGKIVIDPTQCNGCGLCVGVCPFHAIVKED